MVDASVLVKWVIPDPLVERDLDRAAALLQAYRASQVELLEPPHWLAEVGAVLARLRPETAATALDLLYALEIPTAAEVEVYKRAAAMARELNHHLFDTLYHALAIEAGATLVTADERYWRKAKDSLAIERLSTWELSTDAS